jgi:hypothetical protein
VSPHLARAWCTLFDQLGMENRIFFPQEALDRWIMNGTVDLQKSELTILPVGRRYSLTEAVRVMRDVSGTGDVHELAGRVKTRADLEKLGAEIIETSMLIGDSAYDVKPGWVGVPSGTFAEYAVSNAQKGKPPNPRKSGPEPMTDEELLARFVSGEP